MQASCLRLLVLREPAVGSEFTELLEIGEVGIGPALVFEEFEEHGCENRTNGVNRVMTRKPLPHQTLEGRFDRGLVTEQNLILYHNVGSRMEICVWKGCSHSAMVFHNEFDLLFLTKRRPSSRVRRTVGAVLQAFTLHRARARARGPKDRREPAGNSADRTRPRDQSMPPDGTQGQRDRAATSPLQRLLLGGRCISK
jgi:hypothetical protein